ncbi:MAG: DegV family EDD domain-containing protein [Bacteroidetes bacterium]|nr:DegV family EDD domain-containing protein [Bacteroidota bacterium]
MSIHYLNGHRLRRAVIAGSLNLIRHKDHLNKINVFPVADGDTGSNMAATMRAILQRAYDSYEPHLYKMSNAVAESALMAARGNSGAILAQFFQGLSEGFTGKSKADTRDFALAIENAVQMAMDAISKPREGTILTVMRSWSESVSRLAKAEADYRKLIKSSLVDLKRALAETTNQLEVLKKANVVDSGASGFVNIIEGVSAFILSGSVKEETIAELDASDMEMEAHANVVFDPESIHFQYCTEFLLEGKDLKKNELRDRILSYGDSIIVAGSKTKIRVHLHTNTPHDVFQIAESYGTVLQKKHEDMRAQHADTWGENENPLPVSIVVDSSCAVFESTRKQYNITVTPLQVFLGGKEYLDQETITTEEFYNRLRADRKLTPSTSLPNPGRLLKDLTLASQKKDKVLWFSLSSAVSGTYQAGLTAARQVESSGTGKQVFDFDTRTLSLASGFMLEEVVERLRAGVPVETIVNEQDAIRTKFEIYFYLDSVEYLIKGGRLSKVRGFIARLLGMKPILTFKPDGKVEKVDVVRSRRSAIGYFLKKLNTSRKIKRLGVVHAANIQSAIELEAALRKVMPKIDIPTAEVSPVLGSHAGPYAFGFAVQYED